MHKNWNIDDSLLSWLPAFRRVLCSKTGKMMKYLKLCVIIGLYRFSQIKFEISIKDCSRAEFQPNRTKNKNGQISRLRYCKSKMMSQ